MVTHEPDVAAYAKRQIVMKDGKVDKMFTNPSNQ